MSIFSRSRRAALLDVQLKVTGNAARLPSRSGELVRIAADERVPSRMVLPLCETRFSRFSSKPSPSAWLPMVPPSSFWKIDDFERMAQRDLLFLERLRDFDG